MADESSFTDDKVSNSVYALIENFRPVKMLGEITPIDPNDIPAPFSSLLVHDSHMTVAMESFHGHSVSLEVVNKTLEIMNRDTSYTREILLKSPLFNDKAFGVALRHDEHQKSNENRVVQYGVVRINLDHLPPDVVARIQDGNTPLGRILIEADLHREVRCVGVFEVLPGPDFGKLCLDPKKQSVPRTYGRFATISVFEQPVIELFEVVVPSFK